MPSPIALDPPSPPPSIFKKKGSLSKLSSIETAVSYLSVVQQADARARSHNNSSAATPALSLSSSATASSEDIILNEDDENNCLVHPLTPPTSDEVFHTVHSEFGHCANEAYRCVSKHDYMKTFQEHTSEEPPYYILFTTYISYLMVICFGHTRDFFGKRFNKSYFTHLMPHNGYAPLNSDFNSFYTRRLQRRVDDCISQPVAGVPGRTILILDRYSTDYNITQIYTGSKTRAMNISSYNYLGFSQTRGGCSGAVGESIRRYGVSTCGTRLENGSNELHVSAEALVARFLGTEDALVSSMGFATNSTFIPALVGKRSLIISDELNHTSIRIGARQSGADVRMFKHNDMSSLESILREVISQGQPRTHRPWKKILVIVEGLYSMEGTLVNLPKIVELKQKYNVRSAVTILGHGVHILFKFYLFVDEAHSVGAIGPHGRGVTDYFNIHPGSIDVLMGTFTKSFGAAGGYIAGPKSLIDALRLRGHSGRYAEAMTPPVLAQIVASIASIMGVAPPPPMSKSPNPLHLTSSTIMLKDGPDELQEMAPATMLPTWINLHASLADGSEARTRIRRLAFNSRYLHAGLKKLGFIISGHPFSPIVPLLIFNPGKCLMFARMMRSRRIPIVVVVVGYPATPLEKGRARFCASASHTKDDIDMVLRACDEVGGILDLKHGLGERWGIDEICERAVELVHSM
ncbi:pyridoxal phosphate-dependent transferase [Suillus clintonianus]|uniref:pyridoxal phosphate-dependent transferase n=1 Tax=Suillus clintonianus TaxID=1904413 RepID=UPI001B862F34|nr:pyridoxal phosphate-dependent transferase [Suillus clintonianus]KAG2153857.1 pyridoxal phosphate-dependent transferase [Suillus clintonianus]